MDETGRDRHEDAVEAFWTVAKVHARLNPAGSYFGPTTLETVRPPDWQYGENPDEATAFADRLVADGFAELRQAPPADESDLPQVGTLSIVVDGAGEPRALVSTSEVEVGAEEVRERIEVVHAAE